LQSQDEFEIEKIEPSFVSIRHPEEGHRYNHVSMQGSVINIATAPIGAPLSSVAGGFGSPTAQGWAVLCGVKINLPMMVSKELKAPLAVLRPRKRASKCAQMVIPARA